MYLPLADCTVIAFISPLLVTILSVFLLGEKFGFHRWGCVWLFLVWLGLLGAVGHFFMIKAFEKAPASLLSPFNSTSLIWTMFLGFLLFGDLPDAWTIIGATVIISSGLYLVKRESSPAVV